MKDNIYKLLAQNKEKKGNLVSVILPVYNEESSITYVINELFDYLNTNHQEYKFEITFIDDCSIDNSYNLIKDMARKTPVNSRMSVVKLSKNSGSHVAITAGLNICRGDFVIIMSSDGQDPPEVITSLIKEWEQENDLILASRLDNLDHSKVSNFISKIAWKIMNWSTKIEMPETGCDLLGMDKKVVVAFNKMDERNTTFIFRILSLGFKQKEIQYIKRARIAGKSNWTFFKKFSIMLDAITGFSSKPLKIITVFGMFVFFILVIRWVYVFFGIVFLNKNPSMLTIILNTIFTALAVQVLILGFVSDYIWRILDETRKRPIYEISKVDGEVFDLN